MSRIEFGSFVTCTWNATLVSQPDPKVEEGGQLELVRTTVGGDDRVFTVYASDGRTMGYLSGPHAKALGTMLNSLGDHCCSYRAVATQQSSRSRHGWGITVRISPQGGYLNAIAGSLESAKVRFTVV
jgi:hypothetical protein